MCGRFTMTRRDRTELAAMLGVPESQLGDYVPRFNIAPTQPYFVLKTKYESREAIPATWGLVNSWAKDASRASMCINAKAETVDKLPSFREALEKRRCVVPTDGFLEWRGPRTKREPLWIHPADDGALLLLRDYSKHDNSSQVSGRRRSPLSRRPPIDCLSRFTIACRLFST